MSIVRIPPVLRTATGGQKQVEVAGATVREVIDGLVATHPGLAGQLLAEDGDLNRFVNVFLNDTDVRHLQALDTPVEPRDTVLLLPAMAGGADCPSGRQLHNFSDMRIVPAMHRRDFSAESKQKLWRPCREARALGL